MTEVKKNSGIWIGKMELLDLARLANRKMKKAISKKKEILGGRFLSKIKGRGMEFDESRPYQPGDEVRHIDWRVTAKSGKTHTKLFRQERERPVMLVLDQSRSMFFGSRKRLKSVQAARTASLLGWKAIYSGDRVGAIIFSEKNHHEFRPKSNKNGFLRLLSYVTKEHNYIVDKMNQGEWSYSNEFLLSHSLRRLRYLIQPGSLIYVLSDFTGYNEECKKHFFQISKHSQVKAIFVTDPLEKGLTFNDRYAMTDGENITWLNANIYEVRKQYYSSFKQKQEFLANELRLCNVNLLNVSTFEENPLIDN